MASAIFKWKCDVCNAVFPSPEAAAECEKQCKRGLEALAFKKEFRKLFHVSHRDDDRYHQHCIDCGKLLLEWESYYDGHRNERGDIIMKENYATLFGGIYCYDCYDKLKLKIYKAMSSQKRK